MLNITNLVRNYSYMVHAFWRLYISVGGIDIILALNAATEEKGNRCSYNIKLLSFIIKAVLADIILVL